MMPISTGSEPSLSHVIVDAIRLLDASPDGFVIADAAQRVRGWSRGMELIFGISRHTAHGRPLAEQLGFLGGDLLVSGGRGPVERAGVAFDRGNGRRGAVDVVASPLAEATGGAVLWTLRDVSARVESELAAAEVESRFEVMADCAPVLLWMSGTDARCNFFNKTWLDFTGRSLEDELGDGWAEGVHPEDLQDCIDGYMESFRARQPFEMEYRLRRHDGAYRWILDRGTPRYLPGTQFAGYIGSCIDVTDMREARDALARLNEELEETVDTRTAELRRSNAELELFASVASHDLREPLRTIGGFVELLAQTYQGRLDADADRWMAFTVDAVGRLQAMVESLLAYSRITSRAEPARPVGAGAALTAALGNLARSIEESGAEVAVGQLPTVLADPSQLSAVFQNLIANAIRYRSERPPVIEVGAEREGDQWRFAVRDNGVGIAAATIDRLFRPFGRVDKRSGTGLGLAICRKAVERFGGRIWVDSRPGEGSTFYFTLPAAADGEAAP